MNGYFLSVKTNAFAPRYINGQDLFVDLERKISIGDTVVLKLLEGDVLVRTLKERDSGHLLLEDVNGQEEFIKVAEDEIKTIHRVSGVFEHEYACGLIEEGRREKQNG